MPSHTKENRSRRLPVAVNTGATPAGHLNTAFHVNVRPPVPSCNTLRMYEPTFRFVGAATVLLPPSVTVATEPNDVSQLIVGPSVSI